MNLVRPTRGVCLVLLLALVLSDSSNVSADARSEVQLLKGRDVICGERIKTKDVLMINLSHLLEEKDEAVDLVHERVPKHSLVTPYPVLIEKLLISGPVRSIVLIMNTINEAASRGCNLLLVLDIKIYNKQLVNPGQIGLNFPVSYSLVLLGSQSGSTVHIKQERLPTR
jgi:hypothetical protein